MRLSRQAGLAIALLSSIWLASASKGDDSKAFKRCVAACQTTRCATGLFDATIPFSLWITRWTCTNDCEYTCMHALTDAHVAEGKEVRQYFGKWPFWRWAGMQEPASVVFSLLNLVAHVAGYAKIRRLVPKSHPMRSYYVMCTMFGMNAWIWSAVFHTRDLSSTEKLDYFSAALTILNALYTAIIRLFHLYPNPTSTKLTTTTTSSQRSSSTEPWKILRAACVLTYAGHIYYLTSGPRFDYTYNIIFNSVIGLTHNLLWTLYALPSSLSVLSSRYPNSPKAYRPRFANKAGLFVLLTTLATALELLDFAPWYRVIDAHSLWHAATIPLAYFWYEFLVQDALDPSWKGPVLREREA